MASLSLLLGFVNVRAIAELGHPVNYQWLYYSNFMRSLDSYTALAALLSWRWIGVVLVACLALLLVAHLLVLATRRVVAAGWGRFAGTIALGALVTCLGIGWFRQRAAGTTSPKIQNAVVALVGSVLDADANPVLAKTPTRFGPDDFLTAGERQGTVTRTPYTARARRAGVRNVILVVMESVAAEYLWGFGAADSGGTPDLDHYRCSNQTIHELLRPPAFEHPLPGLPVARGLLAALLPGGHPGAPRYRSSILERRAQAAGLPHGHDQRVRTTASRASTSSSRISTST